MADLPHYESLTTESLADAFDLGRRVVARIERAVHELLCGDAAEDTADRRQFQQQILDASGVSDEAVIKAVADFISANLIVMGPVAAIVAKIVVEKVLGPTIAEARNKAVPLIGLACTAWGKSLNERHGVQAAQRVKIADALNSLPSVEMPGQSVASVEPVSTKVQA